MNRLLNRRLLANAGRRRQANPKFFLDTDVFIMSFDRRQRRSCADAQELISTALTTGLGIVSSQVIEEFTSAALNRFHVPLTHPDCRLYLEEVMVPLWRITPTADLYRRALDIRERLQQEHRRQVPTMGLRTASEGTLPAASARAAAAQGGAGSAETVAGSAPARAGLVPAAGAGSAAGARSAAGAPTAGLCFRDCLIIAAALETGCGTLFSQRLPHWQRLDSLLIVHPFSGSSSAMDGRAYD